MDAILNNLRSLEQCLVHSGLWVNMFICYNTYYHHLSSIMDSWFLSEDAGRNSCEVDRQSILRFPTKQNAKCWWRSSHARLFQAWLGNQYIKAIALPPSSILHFKPSTAELANSAKNDAYNQAGKTVCCGNASVQQELQDNHSKSFLTLAGRFLHSIENSFHNSSSTTNDLRVRKRVQINKGTARIPGKCVVCKQESKVSSGYGMLQRLQTPYRVCIVFLTVVTVVTCILSGPCFYLQCFQILSDSLLRPCQRCQCACPEQSLQWPQGWGLSLGLANLIDLIDLTDLTSYSFCIFSTK